MATVEKTTSIKQSPVLSKHFHVPQVNLHANDPVLSKHLSNLTRDHKIMFHQVNLHANDPVLSKHLTIDH